MFRWMYGHEYPEGKNSYKNPTGFHHDVYRLAVYFEMPGLEASALENLKVCLSKNFDAYSFLRILRKGEYRSDHELHKVLIERCREEIRELCNNSDFHAILRKDPELGIELAQSFGDLLRTYECPNCNWSVDT